VPIESSARPTFDNFPAGRVRLNWIGAIWPSGRSDGGYEIEVQLVPLTGVERVPVYVRIALGALPFLVAGSEWESGRFVRWVPHEEATVDVHVGHFESEARAVTPFKLLDPSDYFLYRMPSPCYGRVLRVAAGPDLVVPTWEILRSWYLFHPRVVSAFVGGGLRFPDSVAASLLPWRPERTHWPAGGIPHLVRRKFVADDVAMRLARFLFDPVAAERAYYIYRSLRSGPRTRGDRSWSVPPVLPPYQGVGRWRIWYRDLPSTKERPARRLVMRICAADLPLPYEDIEIVSEADSSQGPNKDDNLPLSWTGAQPLNMLADDGTVELTGDGADSALAGMSLDRFDFVDNAVHGVRMHRPTKLLQTHRHGGGTIDPVIVTKVSVDPTAASQADQAAQGEGGSELTADPVRLPSTVSVVTMQQVFQAVIDVVNGPGSRLPNGWIASFYIEGGACFSVRNPKRDERRRFLAARISDGNRHLYMIEAERLRSSDKFSILICEERHGLELSDHMLSGWLKGFPFNHGSHWLSPTYGGIDLIPGATIHQPHLVDQSEESWFAFFVDRLHRKIFAFVERRYPGTHRTSRSLETVDD
jgi:hypothetical protein